jgi:hypothetical protein
MPQPEAQNPALNRKGADDEADIEVAIGKIGVFELRNVDAGCKRICAKRVHC